MSEIKRWILWSKEGVMQANPDGGWVLWSEAMTAIKDAKAKAYENGIHAGLEKADDMAQEDSPELDSPENLLAVERESVKRERLRTNQLLNELYHDRARLESIIKKHADALKVYADMELNVYVGREGGDEDDAQALCNLLGAFIDAHATDA